MGEAPLEIPEQAGSYLLILQNPFPQRRRVGRLGYLSFPAGSYAYVGSAMGGLSKRVRRYFSDIKKPHWHIDALLPVFHVTDLWIFPSAARQECQLARYLSRFPNAIPVNGFGSTDCRCDSHLFFLKDMEKAPLFEAVKGALACREARIIRVPEVP